MMSSPGTGAWSFAPRLNESKFSVQVLCPRWPARTCPNPPEGTVSATDVSVLVQGDVVASGPEFHIKVFLVAWKCWASDPGLLPVPRDLLLFSCMSEGSPMQDLFVSWPWRTENAHKDTDNFLCHGIC
jgi:hypothetical protein